jgi:ubiquinone biosynthesis protein UbiJ
MPLPSLYPSVAAVRALNALLSREPWAQERLRPHAGKTARIASGVGGLTLRITPEGNVETAEAEAVPEVTLTVIGGKLAALLSNDTAQRMSAVHIDGDAALAHVIGDLARDLRWDVEEDLSRIVGDIPAARLHSMVTGVANGVRKGAWRFAENVAEYLSEESGAVASSYALEAWSGDVRRTRDDAERAAKRVQQLSERIAALEARQGRNVNKG